MPLDQISRAWSAMYDHLYLTRELQGRIVSLFGKPGSLSLPSGLSQESKALRIATLAEVADYFRERRDYIESTATLDLVVSVEQVIREDLKDRKGGHKNMTSQVAIALLNTPNAPGQAEPAARRLLPHWTIAANADHQLIDAVDQAMQYRNWQVHGSIGLPPFVLNPFLLDEPVRHVVNLIKNEP